MQQLCSSSNMGVNSALIGMVLEKVNACRDMFFLQLKGWHNPVRCHEILCSKAIVEAHCIEGVYSRWSGVKLGSIVIRSINIHNMYKAKICIQPQVVHGYRSRELMYRLNIVSSHPLGTLLPMQFMFVVVPFYLPAITIGMIGCELRVSGREPYINAWIWCGPPVSRKFGEHLGR